MQHSKMNHLPTRRQSNITLYAVMFLTLVILALLIHFILPEV